MRLVSLYALRYQKHPQNALPVLLDLLAHAADIPSHRITLIPKLLAYHNSLLPAPVGSGAGGGFTDLFESASLFSGARERFKTLNLKGVENVYTQHSPRLEATLQNLIKGRLRELQYPFLDSSNNSTSNTSTTSATTREKPQDIIIFMVGGVTFEEAKMVAQVNASSPGVRVVLGGTGVVNSRLFLEDVDDACAAWPEMRADTAAGRLARVVEGRGR